MAGVPSALRTSSSISARVGSRVVGHPASAAVMSSSDEYIAFAPPPSQPLRSLLLWLAPLGAAALLGAVAALYAVPAAAPAAAAATAAAAAAPAAASDAVVLPTGVLAADTCHSELLPHKLAVKHVTPRGLQMERGGCWMFAAVALLEHSYRTQGLARGWLHGSEYLKMSEQAFGVAVLDACRAAAAAGSHACVFDGDAIYTGNSTEGGEVPAVYYLSRALASTAALPWSVCPYTPMSGSDRECAGLGEAQRVSPLRFEVRRMSTIYERLDLKRALLRDGRVLALSMPMANVRYLLPCTARNAHNPVACGMNTSVLDGQKTAAVCEPCPLERAFVGVECCVASDREMHTMGGEFFFLPDLSLQLEGGHAVAVVGYSDTFQTEHGHTGGWIVKNSWWDGLPPNFAFWNHARGSHSIDYFLQKISDTDEAALCPNTHSPRSWYPCNDLKTCRAPETAMFARASKRVLRLECLDRSPFAKGLCRRGDRYFLKHLEPLGGGLSFGGGLTQACLVYDDPHHDTSDEAGEGAGSVTRRSLEEKEQTRRGLSRERIDPVTNGGDLCTPPLPVDDLAMVFAPVKEEERPNDADVCGYYFMPYAVLDMLGRRFGGWFATDLDVRWSEASYARSTAAAAATAAAATASAASGSDGAHPPSGAAAAAAYAMLDKDTRTQHVPTFAGSPFPTIMRPVSM